MKIMSTNTLPPAPTAGPALPTAPLAHKAGSIATVACLPFPSANTEQHLVLSGVSWQEYVAFGDALPERHIRMTFDRGTLEIMTLSFQHEQLTYCLGRFLDVLTEEMNIAIVGGGSTTFRREDVERGLEPDRCYWFGNQ